MLIIEIQPLENGAHRNQTCNLNTIPKGWAEVPPGISVPDTFPFVDIEVDGQTVIAMTAGIVPEPEPEPEQPEKKSSGGLLVIVLLLALAGGGTFAYVKFIKPKQGVKVSADPEDYDFEDEEMVNEDDIV